MARCRGGARILEVLLGVAVWASPASGATAEGILWCGGVTHQTANFRVEAQDSEDVFVLHTDSTFPAVGEVARIPVVGGVTAIDMAPLPDTLTPETTYYYALESGLQEDPPRYGSFTTMPAPNTPKSFSFAFASCAESGSEHEIFSEVARIQDEAEGTDHPHLFFLHMGDIFYEDIDEDNLQKFRDGYRKVWSSPSQSKLWRNKPLVYMWDDHDFGANDSDGTSDSTSAARNAYQMFVPHYPLPATPADAEAGRALDIPIYHGFTVGRVRFLVLDLRSESEDTQDSTNWDDASKATMLGAAQKEWLREELEAHASWGMIVMVSSKPWTGAEDKEKCCKWMNYPEERVEVAEMIKATGALNVVMTAGDSHMVAYDDGSNTDFAAGGGAGFPLLHSAPLHQVNSYKGGPYSNGCFARQVTVGEYMQWYMTLGRDSPSTHQFSVMEVTDTGGALADGPISFKACVCCSLSSAACPLWFFRHVTTRRHVASRRAVRCCAVSLAFASAHAAASARLLLTRVYHSACAACCFDCPLRVDDDVMRHSPSLLLSFSPSLLSPLSSSLFSLSFSPLLSSSLFSLLLSFSPLLSPSLLSSHAMQYWVRVR
jgi:hypothetical protein